MATSYTSRLGTSPEEGCKAPCVVAATSNITLSGEQTIDSVTVVAGNRVLATAQTDPTENGPYDAAAGAWTRTTDWNSAEDVISGVLIPISSNGAIYQGTWSGTFVVDTTEPVFTTTSGVDPYDISNYALDSGVADAYVVAMPASWVAHTVGSGLWFKAANASTGASTMTVTGLTTKPIKKRHDLAIDANDIQAGGIYHLRDDGTNYQIFGVSYVGTAGISDGAITATKLATDSVSTTKIIDGNVTYAKLQNVSATNKVLGRETAGAGPAEEIDCTPAGRALIDDASADDQLTTLGVTTAGKALLDDADASAQRTTLGLASVLQMQSSSTSAFSSVTSLIPSDDTIPQSTEGTQLLAQAITPTAVGNKIVVEFQVTCSGSGVLNASAALFISPSTSAIRAVLDSVASLDYLVNLSIRHEYTSVGTSEITFQVRVGPSAGTMYINGRTAGRIFGGVQLATLSATEYHQ